MRVPSGGLGHRRHLVSASVGSVEGFGPRNWGLKSFRALRLDVDPKECTSVGAS